MGPQLKEAMQLTTDNGRRTTDHGPRTLLRAHALTKSFRSGSEEVLVLDDLSLEVQAGEFVALVGESGSGKTTLLHLLAALDTPTKGEVYFEGRRLSEYREDDRALYRNEKIGFVWQMHYLERAKFRQEIVHLPDKAYLLIAIQSAFVFAILIQSPSLKVYLTLRRSVQRGQQMQ